MMRWSQLLLVTVLIAVVYQLFKPVISQQPNERQTLSRLLGSQSNPPTQGAPLMNATPSSPLGFNSPALTITNDPAFQRFMNQGLQPGAVFSELADEFQRMSQQAGSSPVSVSNQPHAYTLTVTLPSPEDEKNVHVTVSSQGFSLNGQFSANGSNQSFSQSFSTAGLEKLDVKGVKREVIQNKDANTHQLVVTIPKIKTDAVSGPDQAQSGENQSTDQPGGSDQPTTDVQPDNSNRDALHGVI